MKTKKRHAGLVLAGILFISISTAAIHARASGNPDETAIREAVQQMEDGWNKKSGSLFATPFAEDADYVVINGMHIKGRQIIESAHQRIFDTIYKDTKVKLAVKQMRFLRPDVAVVHVNGHRDGPTTDLVGDAILTLVITREKQVWKIVAFQNTGVVAR